MGTISYSLLSIPRAWHMAGMNLSGQRNELIPIYVYKWETQTSGNTMPKTEVILTQLLGMAPPASAGTGENYKWLFLPPPLECTRLAPFSPHPAPSHHPNAQFFWPFQLAFMWIPHPAFIFQSPQLSITIVFGVDVFAVKKKKKPFEEWGLEEALGKILSPTQEPHPKHSSVCLWHAVRAPRSFSAPPEASEGGSAGTYGRRMQVTRTQTWDAEVGIWLELWCHGSHCAADARVTPSFHGTQLWKIWPWNFTNSEGHSAKDQYLYPPSK